jgi:hypothetical protein
MKIQITNYDTTLTAEIPDGSDLAQTLGAIRVLLIGVGFHKDSIDQYLDLDDEQL